MTTVIPRFIAEVRVGHSAVGSVADTMSAFAPLLIAPWMAGICEAGVAAVPLVSVPVSPRASSAAIAPPDFELWNPANLGYLAGYAAVAVASGKVNGSQGQSFTAGKLGSFTVGADKTVLLGPPFVFTSDNISQFNF